MPRADASSDVQAKLARAERCANAVSHALLHGQADAIESATRDLHQATLALSDGLQPVQGKRTPDQPLRRRLGQVVQSIAMQREACARRSAVVERSLHSIVPATRASTYGGGSAPYSIGARQSGAFKVLAA